jgi:hypothetical protein
MEITRRDLLKTSAAIAATGAMGRDRENAV